MFNNNKVFEFFVEGISLGTSTEPFGGPFKEARAIAEAEGLNLFRTTSWISRDGEEHFREDVLVGSVMIRRDLWEEDNRH